MERIGRLILISAITALFLTVHCAQEQQPPTKTAAKISAASARISQAGTARAETRKKVWLIGMDGATWHVALPLILKGEMPNFKRLMLEGSHGQLMSLPIMCSPNIWTSMVTGKIPKKHGITYWTSKIPGTKIDAPINNSNRKVRALWNILTEKDYTVGTVGYWTSWPAEAVNGFVVTDHFCYSRYNKESTVEDSTLGQTYPPELVDDIKQFAMHPEDVDLKLLNRFMKIDKDEIPENFSIDHNPINEFRMVYGPAATYESVALDLIPKYDPDFFAIYFQAIDIASHYFWKYMEPRALDFNDDPKDDFKVSAEDLRKFEEVVREVYRFEDEQLGRLLDMAEADENTTIIICSDHGFGAERRKGVATVSAEHRKNGLIIMKGPHIKKNYEIQQASVLDITPTILTLLGLPVARDMDGDVLIEAIEPDYLEQAPIAYIDSFEVTAYQAPDFQHSPINDEIMKSLKNIGYISDDGTSDSPSQSAGSTSKGSNSKSDQPPQKFKPGSGVQINMFSGGWGLRNGEFDQPRGIAFDPDGNLFVSDFRNYRVQKFDETGEFLQKFGWESKGNKEGQFNDAYGVYVADNHHLFVLDTWNGRIQEFDPDGKFIKFLKPEVHPGLFAPKDLTIFKNKIYLTDTGNHRILILSMDGQILSKIGGPGKEECEFSSPCGIDVTDEGYIYVADPGNNRIQILKPNGRYDREFSIPIFEDKPYKEPFIVLTDDGYLFMTHPHKNAVFKYSLEGKLAGMKAALNTPTGIAIHPRTGDIYISNTFAHKIVKFKPEDIKL